ncbi:MAG: hypothetical protein ACRDKF_10240 [Actinomycetota bacterium]
MPLRLRSSLLGVALLAGVLVPIATAGVACAASSAALVVSTGSNNYTYCVELGGSSVNGIQLIQRAGSQHGLQYKLGYGGNAVCMLANVGASGNDCFGEHPYFWGYWRGDSSGGWNWSGTGASNVTVGAGDVNGWSWGTGDSGSSHPPPPATTYESVCGATPAPDPKPEPGKPKGGRSEDAKPSPGTGGSGDGGGDVGETATSSAPGGQDRTVADNSKSGVSKGKKKDGDAKGREKEEPGEDYEVPLPTASPIVTPGAVSNPAGATAQDPDPPVAAFVALGLTGALAALGVVFARRRRRLEKE